MIELWQGRRTDTGTTFRRSHQDFSTLRDALRLVQFLGAGEFQISDAEGEILTIFRRSGQRLVEPCAMHVGEGHDPDDILRQVVAEGYNPVLLKEDADLVEGGACAFSK